MLDGPPPAAELERARRYLLGSFAIDRQRSSTRALQMALDTRYGLHGDFDLDYPERIRAVGAEDVLRVAQARDRPRRLHPGGDQALASLAPLAARADE